VIAPVATRITRILSDLHYGDPASRVRSLATLATAVGGADRIVFIRRQHLRRGSVRPRNRMEEMRPAFFWSLSVTRRRAPRY